jgi:hypothetical protein
VQLRLLRAAAAGAGDDSPKAKRHRRVCSSTAFTTHCRGGTARRRGAMRKASSTAQPRQGRPWADGDFDADHGLGLDGVGRSAGPLEPGAPWSQRGGGGGCARALAAHKPPPQKSNTCALRCAASPVVTTPSTRGAPAGHGRRSNAIEAGNTRRARGGPWAAFTQMPLLMALRAAMAALESGAASICTLVAFIARPWVCLHHRPLPCAACLCGETSFAFVYSGAPSEARSLPLYTRASN